MLFRLGIILLLQESFLSEETTFPMKAYMGIQVLVAWLLTKEGYNGFHTIKDIFSQQSDFSTKYGNVARPLADILATVDPQETLKAVGPLGIAAMRGSDIDAVLMDYYNKAPQEVKNLVTKIKSDIISSNKAEQSKVGSNG